MNWILFFQLLAALESGGESDPDAAIGDGGLAHGRYQIRQEFINECNRIIGEDRYVLADAHDEVRSNAMLVCWHSYWSRAKGTRGDLVAMARQHNGGPNGHRKLTTQKYGRRAVRLLRTINTKKGE
jgi:hypothetical protein